MEHANRSGILLPGRFLPVLEQTTPIPGNLAGYPKKSVIGDG